MKIDFHTFVEELTKNLRQPLPGPHAQLNMAPSPRNGAEFYDSPKQDVRASGVLILFYPYANTVYLPLILRQTYKGVHSGQVGLPGGGRETGDADLTVTALREAHEEIGVDPHAVHVVGSLTSLYISPSNYLVHPVVAWAPHRPAFQIDSREVAMLIEAPLAEFLDPQNLRQEERTLRERLTNIPYFGVQSQVIWGATAMILSELLMLPAVRTIAEPSQV
jgi:8-oxo-dGTP pyrophosphatase MutT (NUDIX family)